MGFRLPQSLADRILLAELLLRDLDELWDFTARTIFLFGGPLVLFHLHSLLYGLLLATITVHVLDYLHARERLTQCMVLGLPLQR